MKPEADRKRTRSPFHPKTWLGRLALATLVLIPGLTGCGGGTSGTDPSGGGVGMGASGQVVIGLTDADGDFFSYDVDVLSLRLTRSDGTTVETIPLSTRVDFAQYTDLTEFLTAATVPVGTYTGAILTLDFSTADVEVEVAGVPVRAKVELAGGGTPGVTEVTVNLAGDRPLKVVPGLPAHLVLDFDLAASNQVDLTPVPPEPPLVTVEPFLLASVNPTDTKPHRLRGLLKKVNVQAHLFQLRVLPLHLLRPPLPVPADPDLAAAFKDGLKDQDQDGFPDHTDGLRDDNHDGRLDHEDGYGFGVFPVKTDDDTVFEINGLPYVGDAGLEALARLPIGSPVVAIGDVNRAGRHMRARQVRAGSSVPWGDKDVVTGVVTAREKDLTTGDDVLTVEGTLITFGDGIHGVRSEVKVLVGPDTTVTRLDVDPATLNADAISVGQRITAAGELLPQVMDSVSKDGTGDTMPSVYPIVPPILDDRNGHVRLLLSTLSGKVVEVGPGSLVVDVRAMNGRDVGIYDFSGTGATPDDDADPAAYAVDTGLLALDFVMAGDPVQVRGFVVPFGAAGDPDDFMARTVVEPALTVDGAALLETTWDPATASPFSASAADGVTVDLTGVGERHHLVQRWRVTDLLALPVPPMIAPPDGGEGSYAIRLDDSLHIYFTFAGFAQAVEDQLADGRVASRLVAHGEWDADLGTLTSKSVALRMGPVTTDPEL